MDIESILQGMLALSAGMLALGIASLREPLLNPARLRWTRRGGVRFFRAWGVSGSFTIKS